MMLLVIWWIAASGRVTGEPLLSVDDAFHYASFSHNGTVMYLGATNAFYLLNLTADPPPRAFANFSWDNSRKVNVCRKKYPGREEVCRNRVLLVEYDSTHDVLVSCVKGLPTGRCVYFKGLNLSRGISYNTGFRGRVSAAGNRPAVGRFSNGEMYTLADAYSNLYVLRRTSLNNTDPVVKSLGEWLVDPERLKMMDVDDWIMLFFNEKTLDKRDRPKTIARVAKVCQTDPGTDGTWSSFQKAQLSCVPPGRFTFAFSVLRDVCAADGGNKGFYAAFGAEKLPGSVLCFFTKAELESAFYDSPFAEYDQCGQLVEHDGDVPLQTWVCSDTGLPVTTESKRFIRDHPLMYRSLKRRPIYFSSVLFDKITAYVASENRTVLFLALQNGTIGWLTHDPSVNTMSSMISVATISASDRPVLALAAIGHTETVTLWVVARSVVFRYRIQLRRPASSYAFSLDETLVKIWNWPRLGFFLFISLGVLWLACR